MINVAMLNLQESESITRSVIVNAIKKLESAGVIEAKSNDMKETYIKSQIIDCIQSLKD